MHTKDAHHVIVILVPLLLTEKRTEVADGSCRRSNGVKRAKIHHVDRLSRRQIGTRHITIQPIANRHSEDIRPFCLSVVGNAVIRALLEPSADLMIQRIVETLVFRDLQDPVRERGISARSSTSVNQFCSVIALRPVFGRFHDARLTCRSHEWSDFRCQRVVSLVEFHSGVDHLLLAEVRELIGAQSVLVIVEESIRAGEALGAGVKLLDNLFV